MYDFAQKCSNDLYYIIPSKLKIDIFRYNERNHLKYKILCTLHTYICLCLGRFHIFVFSCLFIWNFHLYANENVKLTDILPLKCHPVMDKNALVASHVFFVNNIFLGSSNIVVCQ